MNSQTDTQKTAAAAALLNPDLVAITLANPLSRTLKMNPIFSTLITIFSLLLAASIIAAELPESKLSGPKLRIEDARSIARDYIQQHHIQVADSYIDSTRLDLNPGGDRGKFWLVTWQRNEYAHGHPIKGGQFFMRIYMDRTVEVFFGD